MDRTEIKKEVIRIMEIFGMTGEKASVVMNITAQVFRNKKNDNNSRDWFNQKNLDDLVEYIKKEALKL